MTIGMEKYMKRNWAARYGIPNVISKQQLKLDLKKDLQRICRYGRKTPNNMLKNAFPNIERLVDIDVFDKNEGRSNELCKIRRTYYQRHVVFSVASSVIITEHSIKRWLERTGSSVNINSWFSYNCVNPQEQLLKNKINSVRWYHPGGLMCGEIQRDVTQKQYSIDIDEGTAWPGIVTRLKTMIPVARLNTQQYKEWEELRQLWFDYESKGCGTIVLYDLADTDEANKLNDYLDTLVKFPEKTVWDDHLDATYANG